MIRTKLKLTDTGIWNKCWITIQLEMADFPFYDHKAETTDPEKKKAWLSKYKNRYNNKKK